MVYFDVSGVEFRAKENMKILVLSRYTRMGASSRLRLMQYFPDIQKNGLKIELFPFFDDKHLNSQYGIGKTTLLDIIKYYFQRLKHLQKRPTPDLIWLEYEFLPWTPWFIEKLFLPRGVPIISDYDDAIFHRYDSHKYKWVRVLLGSKISKIMNKSNLVIAGNTYLSDYAINNGSKNTKIVPTVVDLDNYKVASYNKNNDKVRIGWIGTPTTFDLYLKEHLPMLESLVATDKCQIMIMGANKNFSKSDSVIDFIEWSEKTEISFIQSLDIGIMPLNDSPWSRGKCGYKLIQYMACGIPVVASSIGVNSFIVNNNVNGYLVNKKEEWIKVLKILVKDSALRRQMGDEGRKIVELRFSLQFWAPIIRDMLLQVIENNYKNKKRINKIENKTITSFGDEWRHFNQQNLKGDEYLYLFKKYFHIFPWNSLPKNACGFDMGCGSGRWASLVAPKVGKLTCIDPSLEAVSVATQNLSHLSNIIMMNSSVFDKPLPINSQDFGYCLGVLHHINDSDRALKECVNMLKPGAPFLLYLYYNFENRPKWYYYIWRISDIFRRIIALLPSFLKLITTNIIATIIYFPLARLAFIFEKIGFNVDSWILSSYRKASFYTMKTDSRDRFGTPLEKRFTRSEILSMMQKAGLENIHFSEKSPFWSAIGNKKLKD